MVRCRDHKGHLLCRVPLLPVNGRYASWWKWKCELFFTPYPSSPRYSNSKQDPPRLRSRWDPHLSSRWDPYLSYRWDPHLSSRWDPHLSS